MVIDLGLLGIGGAFFVGTGGWFGWGEPGVWLLFCCSIAAKVPTNVAILDNSAFLLLGEFIVCPRGLIRLCVDLNFGEAAETVVGSCGGTFSGATPGGVGGNRLTCSLIVLLYYIIYLVLGFICFSELKGVIIGNP